MKVAFLIQEFMRAFKEEMEITEKLEKIKKAIEGSVDVWTLWGAVNLDTVYVKVSKLIPKLGFVSEDAERLVDSFSGG
ncbi:unnamed protein product [Eruca vesicaria subsp. sativa]|uniref:Uncharacterized protein n=1 Tax=Eruca vesicaria subsp. sativa TaxID=29727 RepID=A0ABC8L348_ERUVS|nr:unnamed protein product [Eruca vesicaria subsp. sativa]